MEYRGKKEKKKKEIVPFIILHIQQSTNNKSAHVSYYNKILLLYRRWVDLRLI